MMIPELFFSIHFRPVGQGLFAHGKLGFFMDSDEIYKTFDWVYDCGADKLGAHLQEQIAAYEKHNPSQIDLLILSHFDKDHVLGIRELLQKRRAAVIVVPYLTLAERLASVAALGSNDVEYARFLVDPAASLRQVAGENATIVFVLPGGEPPPEQGEGDGTNPDNPWPPRDQQNQPDRTAKTLDEQFSNHSFDAGAQGYKTYRIDGKNPFVLRNLWEFCFYNRPRPEMEASLLSLVQPVVKKFESSRRQSADYEVLITELRTAFETARGPGKGPRRFDANEISLVVYSGPVRRDKERCYRGRVPLITPVMTPPNAAAISPKEWPPLFPGAYRRCSTLFTGDITLDDKIYTKLKNHFGAARINFVAYFQVPHHGSKRSFQLTADSDFCPDYSIFSSARYHSGYDHPSDRTIEALGDCGPLFVNEFQGLTTGGYFTEANDEVDNVKKK